MFRNIIRHNRLFLAFGIVALFFLASCWFLLGTRGKSPGQNPAPVSLEEGRSGGESPSSDRPRAPQGNAGGYTGIIAPIRSLAVDSKRGDFVVTGVSPTDDGTGYQMALRRVDTNNNITDSKNVPSSEGSLIPHKIHVAPDGKIYAVGELRKDLSSAITITRLNSDTTLDPSFPTVPISAGNERPYSSAHAILLQPDHKIVVGGRACILPDNQCAIVLARLNGNGTLDTTFGPGGMPTMLVGIDDRLSALSWTPDGRILAIGSSKMGATWMFALVKFKLDGTLDPSFGDGGKVLTSLGEQAFAYTATQTSDGRILVGGQVFNAASSRYDMAVVRYLSNGSVDSTFGSSGTFFQDAGKDGLVAAIFVLNKIVIAGGTNSHFMVIQLHGNGALIAPPYANGIVVIPQDTSNRLATDVNVTVFNDNIVAASVAGEPDNLNVVYSIILPGM